MFRSTWWTHTPNQMKCKLEYGLTLKSKADQGAYDAIVAAVNHDEYANYGEQEFKRLLKEAGIIIDVKGVFRGKTGDLDYWSL